MRARLAILAALVAEAHGQLDQRASMSLLSLDPVASHPQCVAYWTTEDESTIVLSGTNVVSWRSIVGNIVATNSTATFPNWIPATATSYPAVNFRGAQLLTFSASQNVMNATFIIVGSHQTNAYFYGFGQADNQAGLECYSFVYGLPPIAFGGYFARYSGGLSQANLMITNGFVWSISHTQATTNRTVYPYVVNFDGYAASYTVGPHSQATAGGTDYVNSLGGRYSAKHAGPYYAAAIFSPPISEEEQRNISIYLQRKFRRLQ